MKFIKKLVTLVILSSFLTFLVGPIASVSAASPAERSIGLVNGVEASTESGTLSINYQRDGSSVPGITYNVYQIIEFDKDGNGYYTEAIWKYLDEGRAISLDAPCASAAKYLAETLEGIVKKNGVHPLRTGNSDSTGVARFSNLPLGYYLVTVEPVTIGEYRYTGEPILVVLKGESGQVSYDTAVNAKFTVDMPTEKTVEFTALKRWDDKKNTSNRPTEIKVQLLRNNEAYGDVVVLNASNEWRYTWTGLDSNYSWKAIEIEVPTGYQVNPSLSENTSTYSLITNTPDIPEIPDKPDEPEKPKGRLPQTGMLWRPVPVLIGIGLILYIIGKVIERKKEKQSEK